MTGKREALPTGWAECELSDLLLPAGTANPAKAGAGTFSYIDIESVDNVQQRIAAPKSLHNESAPSRARNAVRPGDVIFSLVRPYLKNIAVVPPTMTNAVASTAFFVCRPGADVDSRLLRYQLSQQSFIESITTYGSSPPSAHDDEFERLSIMAPPAAEQERIADTLDELFSDLDAAVAAMERVRDKLKLYRASVLKAAVEGELTKDWREQHPGTEPASQLLQRILAERRRRWEEDQLAKFKAKGIAPLANWRSRYREPAGAALPGRMNLPKSWVAVSVDQLLAAPIVNGLSVRGSEQPPGVRALRLSAMSSRGFDYADVRYLPVEASHVEDIAIKAGDFFVSRGNGSKHLVGRGTLAQEPDVTVIFPDTMMRIRVLEGGTQKRWLPTVWPSSLVRHQIEKAAKTTAGILKISQPDLAAITIPLPPLAEQEAIVELVEDQLSVIDHLEADIDAKLKSAQALRQAILRRAFAGQLVPQDPNDEPAAELLERIAAERVASTPARLAMKRRSAKAKAA